jgi:hypothetical protein
MPGQDFRQSLDVLRQQGELVDVDRPAALNDVGNAMKQSYARQGPALTFTENGTEPGDDTRRRRMSSPHARAISARARCTTGSSTILPSKAKAPRPSASACS